MDDTLVARFEYPLFLDDRPELARGAGEVLTRPCFHWLRRVCAERGRRSLKHKNTSADLIESHLLDRENKGITIDSGRRPDPIANVSISNGQSERDMLPSVTVLDAHVYIPLEPAHVPEAIDGFCDLARALDARSGAVTVEPDYNSAHRFGLAWPPRPRPGLSTQRWRERRARQRYYDNIATELAGPEWGTFLGAGHLQRIDVATLRASGAFERVVEVTPALIFCQLTADPADALREDFDARLDRARAAIAPILMDLAPLDLG